MVQKSRRVIVWALFDMGCFWTVSQGRGGGAMMPPPPPHHSPHHNFVVVAPMIMKFDTLMKPDVFYTMVTKKYLMSLLSRNCDVIPFILANT